MIALHGHITGNILYMGAVVQHPKVKTQLFHDVAIFQEDNGPHAGVDETFP